MDKNQFLIMSMPVHFIDIGKIDVQCRLAAAYLIMDALPPYYRIDGIDDAEMAAAVARLIGKPGSETETGFAAMHGGCISGIVTFLKSRSLPRARLIGAQALFKLLSSQSGQYFRNSMRNYNTGFGDVPKDSIYLSRFAVEEKYKGTGLARQMMNRFLSSLDTEGDNPDTVALHVDRKNQRAIRFYARQGFDLYDTGERYLTMVRG